MGHDATMRDGSRFFIHQRLLAIRQAPPEEAGPRGATRLLLQVLGGRPQLQRWLQEAGKAALAGTHCEAARWDVVPRP